MKNFYLILIIFLTLCSIEAKQWLVSNNPNMPAQFSSVQTAIDTASAGDTIYVYSSTSDYGSVNVTKKLHIVGAGYWGVWISGRERTALSTTILADSVVIEGMYISSVQIGRQSPQLLVKGITLKNSYFGNINLIRIYGCLIYNSIINGLEIVDKNYYVENITVTNNIINRLYNPRGSNMLVLNNIFYIDTYSNYSTPCYGSLYNNWCQKTQYTIFQNNIFSKGSPIEAEYSSFNNNLTFNLRQNTIPYGNNNGANNIINQDPKYRGSNAQSSWDGVYRVVQQNIDLRLADDSPARNAGTDSTDIGISGGLYPWPRNADGTYDYSGRPRLPEIENFNLINPIVGTNGRLKFNVKGKKSR